MTHYRRSVHHRVGLVLMVLLVACDSPSGPPRERAPASLRPAAELAGTVARSVIAQVTVLDAAGRGVPDVDVAFSTSAGNGSIQPVARTDALGVAHAVWTLDTVAGTQTATARLQDSTLAAVTLTARAAPAALARIEIDSVTSGVLLHPMSLRAAARAFDQYGNLIQAQPLVWISSDDGVVTVTPDPQTSAKATIATAAGTPGATAVVAAAYGTVYATRTFEVAALHARYNVTYLPFRKAAVLNDRAHIIGTVADGSHAIWQRGAVTALGRYEEVHALNNRDEFLFHQRGSGHSASISGGTSYLVREDGTTSSISGVALSLNENGIVAGWVGLGVIGQSHPEAFIWKAGQKTRIRNLFSSVLFPPSATYASAVNINEQVTVDMRVDGGAPTPVWRPYLWQAGQYTPIPQPDPSCATWSTVDLNDAGTVLLNCDNSAWLWNGSTFTSLAAITRGVDLNNRGEVVGTGAGGIFVWRNGQATRLVGEGFTRPRINDLGQIIITATGALPGAFLLTPAAGGPFLRSGGPAT